MTYFSSGHCLDQANTKPHVLLLQEIAIPDCHINSSALSNTMTLKYWSHRMLLHCHVNTLTNMDMTTTISICQDNFFMNHSI